MCLTGAAHSPPPRSSPVRSMSRSPTCPMPWASSPPARCGRSASPRRHAALICPTCRPLLSRASPGSRRNPGTGYWRRPERRGQWSSALPPSWQTWQETRRWSGAWRNSVPLRLPTVPRNSAPSCTGRLINGRPISRKPDTRRRDAPAATAAAMKPRAKLRPANRPPAAAAHVPKPRQSTAKHGRRLPLIVSTAPGQARDTLRLRVYRALALGLMGGMFTPGEAVSLRTLAARLGTSAMPVREAVSRLIAERALVMLPNRSVIIPRMTRERFLELTRIRQKLEGMLAEMACIRASAANVEHLAGVNAELKGCLLADDAVGAMTGNMTFHFALYEYAGSHVALPLVET